MALSSSLKILKSTRNGLLKMNTSTDIFACGPPRESVIVNTWSAAALRTFSTSVISSADREAVGYILNRIVVFPHVSAVLCPPGTLAGPIAFFQFFAILYVRLGRFFLYWCLLFTTHYSLPTSA